MRKSLRRISLFVFILFVVVSHCLNPLEPPAISARGTPTLQILLAYGGSGYAFMQCKITSDGGNTLSGCGMRIREIGGAWSAPATGYFAEEKTLFSATKSGLDPRKLYEIQGFVYYSVGGLAQYTYTDVVQIRTQGVVQLRDFAIINVATTSATGSIYIIDDGYAPPISKIEFTIMGISGSSFKTAVQKIATSGTSLSLGAHSLTSNANLQIYTEYDAYITVTNAFSPTITGPIRFRTKPLVPAVTTSQLVMKLPAGAGLYNATLRGTVDDGNDLPDPVPLFERGFVCGLSNTPTLANSTKVTMGTDLGTYAATVTGLTYGVQYYYRAYATNDGGTGYGGIHSLIASAPATATPSPSPTPTLGPRPTVTPTSLVKPTTTPTTTKKPATTTLSTSSPGTTYTSKPGTTYTSPPTTTSSGFVVPTTALNPGVTTTSRPTTGLTVSPVPGTTTGIGPSSGGSTSESTDATAQTNSSGQTVSTVSIPLFSNPTASSPDPSGTTANTGSEAVPTVVQPDRGLWWLWILAAVVIVGASLILIVRKQRK